MINKNGYTLVEVCIAMLIMMVVICATVPLLTSRKLNVGTEKYSQLCIVKDNGNISSSNCVNAISLMKGSSTNNSYNNLTYYVQLGTATQKTAALKVLQEACNQGAKVACDYFINLCASDNTKCNISSPTSGLHQFLILSNSSSVPGKLYIDKALKNYYMNGVANIINEVDTVCPVCNTFKAACNIKNYGTGSCTCGSDAGDGMTDNTVKAGIINGYNLCTTSSNQPSSTWNNGTSNWVDLDANYADGSMNSRLILQQNDSATPYRAALACYNLTEGGHSDWYLPSKEELALMRTNKALIGNFSLANYWSSTEQNNNKAYYLNFNDSSSGMSFKNNSYLIRCVRRDY